jgi:hypothetical protein
VLSKAIDYFNSNQMANLLEEEDECSIVFDILVQDIAFRDYQWNSVEFKALVNHYDLVDLDENQAFVEGVLSQLW